MLANQLKKLRKATGMSQLQLATKLNVSPSTIGMYEQGRRVPAIDVLVQIAKLFGVSLDYLIIGTEAYSSITDDNHGEERVKDISKALASCAFEHGRLMLCRRKLEIVDQFMESQYQLRAELQQKYAAYFEDLQKE